MSIRKRLIRRLFAFLLLFALLMPPLSRAKEIRYATVIANDVFVRTGPGVHFDQVTFEGQVVKLGKGYGVEITGDPLPGTDGNGAAFTWYPVEFPYNGTTLAGYIRNDLISVVTFDDPGQAEAGNASFALTCSGPVWTGTPFSITVTLSADRPIGAWYFELEYDNSVLTYLSGADAASENKLLFCDSCDGTDQLTFSVTFVTETTENTTISVSNPQIVGYDDVLNMAAQGAFLTVCGQDDIVLAGGDVNGDGVVDVRDIVRLKRYFADFDFEMGTSSVTIYDPGADVNGDGTVDVRDLVRLKNYFAAHSYSVGD